MVALQKQVILRRNPNKTGKNGFQKYDPVIRKHVEFKEQSSS